jgi:hypothetical protein
MYCSSGQVTQRVCGVSMIVARSEEGEVGRTAARAGAFVGGKMEELGGFGRG